VELAIVIEEVGAQQGVEYDLEAFEVSGLDCQYLFPKTFCVC